MTRTLAQENDTPSSDPTEGKNKVGSGRVGGGGGIGSKTGKILSSRLFVKFLKPEATHAR